MTIEHTEGDLTVSNAYGDGSAIWITADSGAKMVLQGAQCLRSDTIKYEQISIDQLQANARRLAAKGITTESLEANGAAGYEHTVALVKQANDLRTVLLSVKLEWAALWAAMDALPEEWIPTTVAMYQHMLEIVPPRLDIGSRFLVGEPQRHNEQGKAVHACFRQVGKEYFARYMTVEQFKAM